MKSDALKNMPKIPPEQIEQMKKMGISPPQMQQGGITSQVCISKAMAEREEPFMERKDSGCQTKNFQRSGSTYAADVVCDGPNMKGAGKVKGTFNGNESFNSTFDFKGTSHGQPVDMKHDTSGKWLSADCGKVKPADELVKK